MILIRRPSQQFDFSIPYLHCNHIFTSHFSDWFLSIIFLISQLFWIEIPSLLRSVIPQLSRLWICRFIFQFISQVYVCFLLLSSNYFWISCFIKSLKKLMSTSNPLNGKFKDKKNIADLQQKTSMSNLSEEKKWDKHSRNPQVRLCEILNP